MSVKNIFEIFHIPTVTGGEDVDVTINVDYGDYNGEVHRSVVGTEGDDSLEQSGYFSTVDGRSGNDTLTAYTSYATLDGGDGDDYLLVDTSRANDTLTNVMLTGGAGHDTFAFAPGNHTIMASLTDFNPDEDTLTLVTTSSGDNDLAMLAQLLGGGINANENDGGFAAAQLLKAAEAARSASIEGFSYQSDTKVAYLNLPYLGFTLSFPHIDNDEEFDRLTGININIVDDKGQLQSTVAANEALVVPNGLEIRHSEEYDQDWLYVYSDYKSNVWLGGVDYKGNTAEGYSNNEITNIYAESDTVAEGEAGFTRMLAGNALDNYIYAGSRGVSLWGGPGGNDYLFGGEGADTFIAAASANESYTNMRDVGSNDIVHLESIRWSDIATISGNDTPSVIGGTDTSSGGDDTGDDDTTDDDTGSGGGSDTGSGGAEENTDDNTSSDIESGDDDTTSSSDDTTSSSNGNDTVSASVYLEGYSSGFGTDPQYTWRIWTYDNYLYVNNSSNGTAVYVNHADDALTTTLHLADNREIRYNYLGHNWDMYAGGTWRPLALDTGELTTSLRNGRRTVVVNNTYEGSVFLADYFSTYDDIDAAAAEVDNRILVGNERDNSITAGAGSTSIWGGFGGNDTLVGYTAAAGNDTFIAGRGEGNTTILNCGAEDIVFLSDTTLVDIAGFPTADQNGIELTLQDGTVINVRRLEDAATTRIVFANYATWLYNYGTAQWSQIVDAPPEGIHREGGAITVTSAYEGNLYIGDYDLNGSTLGLGDDTWHDDGIEIVNAASDTVVGRTFVGNDGNNIIRAGSGGAILWGGRGGEDTIYGGDGADTFIAGNQIFGSGDSAHREGDAILWNVGDEDIVSLRGINVSDIANAAFYEGMYGSNQLRLTTNDGTNVYIWYSTDTTVTNLIYSNGDTRSFDHVNGDWTDLFVDTSSSLPSGLSKIGNVLYVGSTYRGDVYLGGYDLDGDSTNGWSDTSIESISAVGNTVHGAMLAGNVNNNTIRAGSGGASIWGGLGGRNYLYGGAGDDTYIVATDFDDNTTYVRDVGANDVIYLQSIYSSNINSLNNSTSVYIEGITPGYSYNAAWRIRTYGSGYISIYDNDYDKPVYIYREDGASTTTFQFAGDDNYQIQYNYSDFSWYTLVDDVWTPYVLTNGELTEYTTEGGARGIAIHANHTVSTALRLDGSDYFSSFQDIDATDDYVSGRALVGNGLDNSIVAGSRGASVVSGGGSDTFVGGDGVDTFDVREDDDTITILNAGDDDLVILENTYLNGLSYSSSGSTLNVTMDSGTVVKIRGTDDATGTLIRFADYSQLRYNYSTHDWDTVVPAIPDGLIRDGDNITLTSTFEGDLWLGGINMSLETMSGWMDNTVVDLSAINDTVSGRMLAGNANDNRIYAGSGGASLWGGNGGYDYLYGGDGNDTFIVATGLAEGVTNIRDIGDEDIIYLYDVSASNINTLNNETSVFISGLMPGYSYNAAWRFYVYDTYIALYDSDFDNNSYIYRKSGAEATTFRFNDGYLLQYNYNDSLWSGFDSQDNIWKPFAITVGLLSEYTTDGGAKGIAINSAYTVTSDLNLDSSDYFRTIQDINAANDIVSGRSLFGNDLNNSIVAGSNGAFMWGGDGDDTLVGGAGNDTFVVQAGEDTVTILNLSDDDVVSLANTNFDELSHAGSGSSVSLTMSDGTVVQLNGTDDATGAMIRFSDYSQMRYDYSTQSWITIVPTLPDGLIREGNDITVTAAYTGNIAASGVDWNGNTIEGYSDPLIDDIDASAATVGGRLLAGDSNNNDIHAGSGGNSLWGGGGGIDYLYGGAGADTFIAGDGDSLTNIWYCGDNDLVYLYNVSLAGIANVSQYSGGYYYDEILITTAGGARINIWYDKEETSETTLLFADGTTRTFDHVNGNWTDLFVDNSADIPAGLTKVAKAVYVSPTFNGNIALEGVDWSGTTVEGYSDTSIVSIDAQDNTVSGILLAGNSRANRIYAGSGGASLWGGNGGYDVLYGGSGSDTFLAGTSNGATDIFNCGNEDVIFLYDISLSDIVNVTLRNEGASNEYVSIDAGSTNIYIQYSTDTTLTSLRFADGTTRTWDHINGSWQDLFVDSSGLLTLDTTVVVTPSFTGNIALDGIDWNGELIDAYSNTSIASIDARNNTVEGMLLAGNSNATTIRAGSGGASMWGGNGSANGTVTGWNNLYGGEGSDTFIIGMGNGRNAARNVNDEDTVSLYNINVENISYAYLNEGASTNNLVIVPTDRSYINIWYSTDTTLTRVRFANGITREFDHENGSWLDLFADSSTGLAEFASDIMITSAFEGNIALDGVDWNGSVVAGYSNSSSSIVSVDARFDTVGGRFLAGNSRANRIYAGSGGASMWGGTGSANGTVTGWNNLYGGAGSDTFIIGMGNGRNAVQDCGDEDTVYLYNINVEDISYTYLSEGSISNNLVIVPSDDTSYININYNTDTTITRVRFADGVTRTFDHENGSWIELFVDSSTGLVEFTENIMITSEFEGNVALDGVDWNGSVVAGYSNSSSSIVSVDARFDTVGGRFLAGNSRANRIYAGSGGASLWGGHGGYDYLYGGDGSDTFIAGSGDGVTDIYRCGNDDVVYLYNADISDISSATVNNAGTSSEYISIGIDGTNIVIQYDDATLTTIQYKNGERRSYDHVNGSWTDLFIDTSGNLPAGLTKVVNTVYVSSEFEGNIALDGVDWSDTTVNAWSADSITAIDASNDTVGGRLLAGNSLNNDIYAGSGGASMWGGHGGYDYLYGGAGADTFLAGSNDGYTDISNCGSEDIIVLYDVNVKDIAAATASTYLNYIQLATKDGSNVYIRYSSDTALTRLQYADGETRIYNHTSGHWQDLFTDEDATIPTGLTLVNNNSTVQVSSEYEGALALGGVDWNNDTVDSWSNAVTAYIDASNDTVGGRMLAGNSFSNRVRAGSGGASLWGGAGGYDYLYGGDGADTFIAGDSEGSTDIYNCSDDDIVCLHNVNPADIENITVIGAGTASEYIRMSTANTYFYIRYDTDTTSTTVVYADGTRTQYDHSDGTWSTLQSSASLDELWGGDDAVDDLIRADVDDDPLASVLNVAGNVALNELNPLSTVVDLDGNSLIMKYAADLRRRSNR